MAYDALVAWMDHGDTKGAFTQSLVNLGFYSTIKELLAGAPRRLEHGPTLDTGRNLMVDKFLETDAAWLLMIDADMTFDPDALGRLIKTAETTPTLLDTPPIVSGLAYTKTYTDGQHPAMYRLDDDGLTQPFTDWTLGDVVDVDATGAACLLVHRDVYLDLLPGPFDRYRLAGRMLGEDIAFGLNARKKAHRIVVDTGVEFRHLKLGYLDHASWLRQEDAKVEQVDA